MPKEPAHTPLPWAQSDQRPELVFADKQGMIDINQPVARFKNAADATLMSRALSFLDQMADFTTPDDEFEQQKKEDGDDCRYEDADELMADLGEERLYGEYVTFMDMVRAAREIRNGGAS